MAVRIDNKRDMNDMSTDRLTILANVWAPGMITKIEASLFPGEKPAKNFRDSHVRVRWNNLVHRWDETFTRRELELVLLGCARWREFAADLLKENA